MDVDVELLNLKKSEDLCDCTNSTFCVCEILIEKRLNCGRAPFCVQFEIKRATLDSTSFDSCTPPKNSSTKRSPCLALSHLNKNELSICIITINDSRYNITPNAFTPWLPLVKESHFMESILFFERSLALYTLAPICNA